MRVHLVCKDIWCLRWRSYLSCSYVIRTAKGIAVIDAGMDTNGDSIINFIRSQRRPSEQVTGVYLTHWHSDHAAGAAAIAMQLDCPVFCGRNEAPKVSHSARQRFLGKLIPPLGPLVLLRGLIDDRLHPAVAEVSPLDDGVSISGITAIATPGHTAGHFSYHAPELGVLFAGDSLAIVQGKLSYMSRKVTPDRRSAIESMKKLCSISPGIVCAGHRFWKTTSLIEWGAFSRHLDTSKWPAFGRLG